MSSQLYVSVIVPFYNAEIHIKKCLDVLRNQDFNKLFEVIMVDDGSTDNSQNIIKEYNYHGLQLYSLSKNSGPAAARNVGLKKAKGEYIFLLDVDDAIDPNTLTLLYNVANETNCDYVMIGRGAMGNPFLFEQINDYLKTNSYHEYSFKDRLDSFFDYMHLTNNYKIKFANIKSQAMRFTKGMKGGSKLRSEITFSKNIEELEKIMKNAYA